jgi:hypothetical protein
MPEPLLEMTGISKSFGGTPVLQNVDFNAWPGEVHALLGENDTEVVGLALLGGLVAVLFAGHMTWFSFLITSSIVIVGFGFIELIFRDSKRAAISRVSAVEEYMQSPSINTYSGPRICQTLSVDRTGRDAFKSVWTELGVAQVWTFYLILTLAVTTIALSSRRQSTPETIPCCCSGKRV